MLPEEPAGDDLIELIATGRLKTLPHLFQQLLLIVGRPAPAFAERKQIRVGQWAMAVGRAFDPRQANMAVGIVSALDRIWGRALQTDAAVSPNNYGGPLVDLHGRVLGLLVPMSPASNDEVAGIEVAARVFSLLDSEVAFEPLLGSHEVAGLELRLADVERESGQGPQLVESLEELDVVIRFAGLAKVGQGLLLRLATEGEAEGLPIISAPGNIKFGLTDAEAGEAVSRLRAAGVLTPDGPFVLRGLHAFGASNVRDASGPTRGVMPGACASGHRGRLGRPTCRTGCTPGAADGHLSRGEPLARPPRHSRARGDAAGDTRLVRTVHAVSPSRGGEDVGGFVGTDVESGGGYVSRREKHDYKGIDLGAGIVLQVDATCRSPAGQLETRPLDLVQSSPETC